MANSSWSQNVLNRLLELQTSREINKDLTDSDIAGILNEEFQLTLTSDAVHGKLYRECDKIRVSETVLLPTYEKFKSQIHDNSRINTLTELVLAGKKKILVLSDLHIPYMNKDALNLTLNLNAAADVVVISEIMDLGSQSSFAATDNIPLELEVEETLKLLELLSTRFPLVIVIEANHDYRLARKALKVLPTEFSLLVEETNLMQLLVRPFKNVVFVPNWWVQIEDAIICHASKTSTVSMKVIGDLDMFFKDHHHDLGLRMPYRVLVQGHTHQLGVLAKPDLKLFESGMLCSIRSWYQKIPSRTCWITGFVVVEMQDGKSLLNKCREYMLPSEIQGG